MKNLLAVGPTVSRHGFNSKEPPRGSAHAHVTIDLALEINSLTPLFLNIAGVYIDGAGGAHAEAPVKNASE